MNKENAHLYLPLVQALADGKAIEHSYDGIYWEKIPNNVDFLFSPDQYRIAIEPRKPAELLIWVKEDGTPTLIAYGHKEGDKWGSDEGGVWELETARLFREVTNQ